MKKGYQEPTDMSDCSMQHAYSTKDNFFEHLMANPPYGLQFNQHMGGYRQGRPSWMDAGFYLVQERLILGFDDTAPDAALLVDVGGGLGIISTSSGGRTRRRLVVSSCRISARC